MFTKEAHHVSIKIFLADINDITHTFADTGDSRRQEW